MYITVKICSNRNVTMMGAARESLHWILLHMPGWDQTQKLYHTWKYHFSPLVRVRTLKSQINPYFIWNCCLVTGSLVIQIFAVFSWILRSQVNIYIIWNLKISFNSLIIHRFKFTLINFFKIFEGGLCEKNNNKNRNIYIYIIHILFLKYINCHTYLRN